MGTVSRAATFGRSLGLKVGDDGRFVGVNSRRELRPEADTTEEGGLALGAFAAGDCVGGLNQISVASGDAAVAATSINKLLNDEGHVVRA